MAAKKKTIKVDIMLEYANTQLRRTDEFADKSFKAGVCVMIEKILRDANTYNGYCHLDADNSDTGTLGDYSRCYFKLK